MDRALFDKIKGLWPSWQRTPDREHQLSRMLVDFNDDQISYAIDQMADDTDIKFFDSRVLRDRLIRGMGSVECRRMDRMADREIMADQHRRSWMKLYAAEPDRHPNYEELDDDQILALYEQAQRKEMLRAYGHIAPHYDYHQRCWVAKGGEPDPAKAKTTQAIRHFAETEVFERTGKATTTDLFKNEKAPRKPGKGASRDLFGLDEATRPGIA